MARHLRIEDGLLRRFTPRNHGRVTGHYLQRRHHRACPGDPRPGFVTAAKTWMAGTSPAMTTADSQVNCLTHTHLRDPAARYARVLLARFARLKIRGRRECRALDAPAASHAK